MRGFVEGEYQDGEVRGRVFVAGASCYGKTVEMIRMMEQCEGGVVFFDTTGQNSEAFADAVIVHEPGALTRALRFFIGSGREHFRIIYQPMGGDLQQHFQLTCTILAQFASLTFGIDEVDSFCSPKWGDSRMSPELYNLAHWGRHSGKHWNGTRRGVAMIYTARIPTSVARALTSQVYEMRLFHEHEKAYVDYYADGPIGRESAEKLKTLPKFKYFIWHDGQPLVLAGGARSGVR